MNNLNPSNRDELHKFSDEGVVLAIVIVDVALTAAIVIVVAITGLDPGRDLGIAIADQKVGKLGMRGRSEN